MKSNFKLNKPQNNSENLDKSNETQSDMTPEEFEEFIIRSGAAGSFMIFRSEKKKDELGLNEL